MLLVTFHGGKIDQHKGHAAAADGKAGKTGNGRSDLHPPSSAAGNNVHAYDKTGKCLTNTLLDDKAGIVLSELRGLVLRGNLLYVVVANKDQNSILCYKGHGTSYHFKSIFANRETSPGILHPFDLTFDDKGFCYLSSQDTNLVTRLKVSADGLSAQPAPIAPALSGLDEAQNVLTLETLAASAHAGPSLVSAGRTAGNSTSRKSASPARSGPARFLSGTFVASSIGTLSDPPTTPVSSPAGLAYSGTGLKKHSVRGVLWTNNALYVADQPAGRIKVYDADGHLIGQSNQVESPVHLTVHKKTLYVTGGNQVLSAPLTQPAADFTLAPIAGPALKNSSGLAFTNKGKIYLASRTGKIIRKFTNGWEAIPFHSRLPDDPEFLLFVP